MAPDSIIKKDLSIGGRIRGIQNQVCLLVCLVKQLAPLVLVALDFSHPIVVLVLVMSQAGSENW